MLHLPIQSACNLWGCHNFTRLMTVSRDLPIIPLTASPISWAWIPAETIELWVLSGYCSTCVLFSLTSDTCRTATVLLIFIAGALAEVIQQKVESYQSSLINLTDSTTWVVSNIFERCSINVGLIPPTQIAIVTKLSLFILMLGGRPAKAKRDRVNRKSCWLARSLWKMNSSMSLYTLFGHFNCGSHNTKSFFVSGFLITIRDRIWEKGVLHTFTKHSTLMMHTKSWSKGFCCQNFVFCASAPFVESSHNFVH